LQYFPNNIRVFFCQEKKAELHSYENFRIDFKEFSGIWSDLELAEFHEKIKDLSSVKL
jgi:hypothetical protein